MNPENSKSNDNLQAIESFEELLAFQDLILTLATEFIHIKPEDFDAESGKILRKVGEAIGVDRVYIFIRDEQNHCYINTYEWCRKNVSPQIDNLQHIHFDLYQPIREIIHQAGNANISDISIFEKNEELYLHFKNQEIQSFLMLPLFGGGNKIGLIGFDSVLQKRDFSEKEIALLKVLSNVIGNAIFKHDQEKKIVQSEHEFFSLFESMSQGVIYQDYAGKIIKVNKQLTKILGLTLNQFSGLEAIDRAWHVVKPDGATFPSEQFPNKMVIKTHLPQLNVEMGVYRPEYQSYVWTLVNSVPEFSKDSKKLLRVLTTVTDITDLKIEQQLKRKEELKFRKLVENLPGAAYLGKFDGTYSTTDYISEKVFDVLGYTSHEILVEKFSFQELYHPMDYDESRQILKNAIKNKNPFHLTYRIKHKKGHWVWIEEYGEGVFENDELQYLIGFFVDVSDRKKHENQILLNSKLQDLLMKISSTYISIEPECLDEAINKSLAELGEFIQADRFYIFSYNFEQMTCSNSHEWCAAGVDPQIDVLQDVPLEEIPDWVNTHKEGRTLIVYDVDSLEEDNHLKSILAPQGVKSLITIPLMESSNCTGFMGLDFVKEKHHYSSLEEGLLKVFADMLSSVKRRYKLSNELMEKQQFLADIIENNESLFYVKNLKGQYLLVNKKWEKTSRVNRDKAIGKRDSEIFLGKNEQYIRAIEENDEYVFKKKRVLHKEEELLIHGKKKYYETIKFPFKDKAGNTIGVAGISTEVTKRKLAEVVLKDSEERFKTIFEKNASPMYLFDPLSRRFVDVNQAAEQYYGYSKEVFLTLKLEDINVTNTDLDARIRLVKETKRQRFEFKNKLADGTLKDVEVFTSVLNIGEKELIHSIVHDITERNEYLETVESQNKLLQEIAWEQSHVVRAPLARMMGLFNLLDEQNLDKKEKQFVREEIVSSAKEIDEIIKQVSLKTGQLHLDEIIHSRMKNHEKLRPTQLELLLIDDDMVVQMVHKKMITKNGIHDNPKVFLNAKDGLSYIIEKNLPDIGFLILLDINMPGMNGWEFLDELSKIEFNAYVEVIMLTSSIDVSDKRKARQYQLVVDYLTKPMSMNSLNVLKERFKHLENGN